jgi:hemin uptake protein HemP
MNAKHDAGGGHVLDDATERKEPGRPVLLVGNRLESRELFVATREITIGHAGDVYRLRLTSQNKLILTK